MGIMQTNLASDGDASHDRNSMLVTDGMDPRHLICNSFPYIKVPSIIDVVDRNINHWPRFTACIPKGDYSFSIFKPTSQMEFGTAKKTIEKVACHTTIHNLLKRFAKQPSLADDCILIALGTSFHEPTPSGFKVWYPCITYQTEGEVGYALGFITLSDDQILPDHYHILVKTKK